MPTLIEFKNGSFLRFMGAGGNDAQRSSHTARIIIMTEVDKYDDIGETSQESSPVSQIEMRADSFEDSKIIYECTVTGETGKIWQEAMVHGSGANIFVPCYHCGFYQTLIRDQLTYEVDSIVRAEKTARYKCISCQALWDNEQRLNALQYPKILHRGQNFDDDWNVCGDLPETKTFGLHFNVLYSPMQSIGKTAGQQWEADRSDVKEKKKAMIQSKWALPWKEDQADEITVSYLMNRAIQSNYLRGKVPEWADMILFNCDVQDYGIYWSCTAFSHEQMALVVDHGVVDTTDKSDLALTNCLNRVYELAIKGWHRENSEEILLPRMYSVDVGHRPDVMMPWLVGRPQWVATKGIGTFQRNRMHGVKSTFTIPGILQIRLQESGQYIWFIEVDQTKALAHDRLILPNNVPNSLILPADTSRAFYFHMCSEKRVPDDKGFKWEKVKGRRANHWLDCISYSMAVMMYCLHVEAQTAKVEVKQQNFQEKKRAVYTRKQEDNFFTKKGRYFS